MSYEEAVEHIKTCDSNTGKNKIQILIDTIAKDKVKDNPNKTERCVKCDCIPLKPLYYWNWARCLYWFYCRADGEKWRKCDTEIKSVWYAEESFFESKIHKHQISKYKCRFWGEPYPWDSLAIHERIWYKTTLTEDEKDDFTSDLDPKTISNDYLRFVAKIIKKVRK